MSGPTKIHVNKSVLFITSSLEEGILLLPNATLEAILQSSLARAQELHPLIVCDLLVEGNHVHLIAVVGNPDDVKDFMGRFKTESSHGINHLLGRKKRTIWCEGYDSPPLLTAEDVIREIVYIYTNPAKDCLVESIEEYPGLNTWKMVKENRLTHEWNWIHRPTVPCIKGKRMTEESYKELAEKMIAKSPEKKTFTLEPDAWMECFGITSAEEKKAVRQQIEEEVKEREEFYRQERLRDGKRVMGRERLVNQQLNTTYQPERHGKRMWCISADRELRRRFIDWAKELVTEGREVLKRWRMGDVHIPYPVGLYPPSLPKRAELLPVW